MGKYWKEYKSQATIVRDDEDLEYRRFSNQFADWHKYFKAIKTFIATQKNLSELLPNVNLRMEGWAAIQLLMTFDPKVDKAQGIDVY